MKNSFPTTLVKIKTSCFLVGSIILITNSTIAENLLDPAIGAEFTHIDDQANATTAAATNLLDNDFFPALMV